ncbi:MAG: DUF3290 family protein [Stomatobaculum longum]|jgi:hypothetical protein|uniref:DUF3290 family protein n=1 Tax=Stomatobaculum longum TaxID=796942 RepID=UPI001CAEEBFE|nr:DUF3290 family protein [Stomatobaculum longum]MBF1256566.1 DUF3290 family protein [Stomatobaculum longum]
MKFYSYEFLLRRNIGMNRVQLVIAAVLFLVLFFNGIRYFKDKQISRYRELALIALLLLITMGLLQINRYREMQASGQRAELAIHSVERIAKELDVPAEEVFLNATEFSGNPIIFAEGKYYRVLFINDTSCNLEPIELLGTEPEFIRE